jgi:hypothetical protein
MHFGAADCIMRRSYDQTGRGALLNGTMTENSASSLRLKVKVISWPSLDMAVANPESMFDMTNLPQMKDS